MKYAVHTERLTLIPLSMSDTDLSVELFTDPVVSKYFGGVMSEKEIHEEHTHWVQRGFNGYLGLWCVTDKDTGEKLGTGALLPMPIKEDDTDWSLVKPDYMPDNDIEIGYIFKQSAWGKGYATETCNALLRIAFEEVSLSEVVATYEDGNDASRHVLLKCGYEDKGRRLCYGEDSPDLRITREQWLRAQ